MPSCIHCGRDIEHGRNCPFCGSSQPDRSIATPGVLLATAPPPREISATHIIVGINVAVFLGMALSGASLLNPTREQLLLWGANWGPLSLGAQPWRMLTANYVHIGLIHILFNMWCLWNLGQLAERIIGRWTFVVLYTLCGLAGSLASLWWHPMTVGAGASGAIFGLAGAAIAVFYLGHLPIPKPVIQNTMRSLLTFVAYNLFFGLTPGIDNSAHIGGLACGLVMGAAISKHIMVPSEVRHAWTRLTAIAMAVVLLMAGLALKRHYPDIRALAQPSFTQVEDLQAIKTLLQQGRTQVAVDNLQSMIKRQPDFAEPHYLLGIAYMQQRRFDPAIASFLQALKLQPDYFSAESALGAAYRAKGMDQEADDAFAKAEQMEKKAESEPEGKP